MFKYLFNRQYRMFKKKIRDTQVAIWEHEFKIAKSRQIREGIRQDRDRVMEALSQIDAMLKRHEEGPDKMADDLHAQAVSDKTKLEGDAQRYESQMRMIDEQIYGASDRALAPGENPPLMDTIKALTELQAMYLDYANKL